MAHKHSPKLCLAMGFLNLLWKIVFNKIQIVDVKLKLELNREILTLFTLQGTLL